jgi:UDPglucose 6-dehydrogenase
VENKEVGILGLAFKPNTNSVAGSSAVRLAETLVSKGAHVRAYDPVAISEAKTRLNGSVRYCDSAYAAAEGWTRWWWARAGRSFAPSISTASSTC